MDDYGFYAGKQTGMENFREKLAQNEKSVEQKIQRTADELLSDYRKQKNPLENKTKKAFKLLCTPEDFKQIIKNTINSHKTQQLGSDLVLAPCIFFEYQYLRKTCKEVPQKPQKTSTVLSLYESDQSWRPELCKEVNENNINEIKDGPGKRIIEFPNERAEEQIAMLLSVAIHDSSSRFSPWKSKLNVNASPKGIQSLLRVEVIYLPFWVAKFQTDKRNEYLVCDRLGKKREQMNKIIGIPSEASIISNLK
jgi:hypothetical protein